MNNYSDIGYLIEQMTLKKNEAWSYFLNEYRRLIYHCINKVVIKISYSVSQEDREDCYQEILRILFEDNCRRLKELTSHEERSFRSWISVVSTRSAMNFFYRMVRPIQLSEEISKCIPDKTSDLDEETLFRQISDIVTKHLETRECLVILYLLDGLTLDEIAKLMGIGRTSVHTIKGKGIEAIKKYFKVQKKNGNTVSYN